MIKTVTGWIHDILIFTPMLPACYAFLYHRQPQVENTIFFASLLIAVPIVVTSIAINRCRRLWQYLFIGAAVTAAAFFGALEFGKSSGYGGLAQVYAVMILVQSVFIMLERILRRIDRKREQEARENQDVSWQPRQNLLEQPRLYLLMYFFVIYMIGKYFDSGRLCNEALVSAFLYFLASVLYRYIDETEQYLSLHRRVLNLPVKRIYGISGAMLAVYLLFLMFLCIPAFATIPYRQYHDIRDVIQDRKADYKVFGEAEQSEQKDFMQDTLVDMEKMIPQGKGKEPFLLNVIVYFLGGIALAAFAAAAITGLRNVMRDFREARDDNGDLVEELDVIEDVKKVRSKGKQTEGEMYTEREKVRRRYRKTIRKYRKDVPHPHETPFEIETNAGIAESEEAKELHVLYEQARYGRIKKK